MNAAEPNGTQRLDGIEPALRLIDGWTESLAQVLESMTDRKPEVRWQAASGALTEVRGPIEGPDAELLWWEQPFQIGPGTAAWIAAPRGVWEYAGTLTLKAAGLETVEIGEAKNTWFEILGQSLGAVARALTALMGHEVTTETGAERAPEADLQEWAVVSITFGETQLPALLLALSSQLITSIAAPRPNELEAGRQDGPPKPDAAANIPLPKHSRTMDLLLDVDLPVSISFGRTRLPMKDVLKLTTGSIVELNRGVSDPVEVLVNQCLIARGEVVVVEGNYGVRIQEIASRHDRLRTIR
jgi:flagellar motor switch protein FliN/FliY